MLVIKDNIQIPPSELEWSFSRSSGPGGQNVNKVNSRASLRWDVRQTSSLPKSVKDRFLKLFASKLTSDGALLLHSGRYRDQPRNIDDCLEKLRRMVLEAATPPKIRKPTKPSKAKREARMQDKKRQSDKKQTRQKVRF